VPAALGLVTDLIANDRAVAAWAASGGMWLTGAPAGPPHPHGAGAGALARASLEVVAGLAEARTGRRPHLPTATLLGERAAIASLHRNAPWSAGGATRTVRGADRWWALTLSRASDVETIAALVEGPSGPDPWTTVDEWAATVPAVEAVDRAQLLGLPAAVVPDRPDETDDQRDQRGPNAVIVTRGGRRGSPARPLVVDFTALWAGPLCSALLGAAGCEVVKVESARRLDGARLGPSLFYDLLHAGHRSITLDFTDADDRARLRSLIDRADVVLEASRPRALEHLGINAHEVVQAGTIWVSITAYGRTGPWANRAGFGDDAALAGGLHTVVDGRPAPCADAVADPLTGVYAAAAASGALGADHAALLDVSMRDVAAVAAGVVVPSCAVDGSEADGWWVECDGGRVEVARPVHRIPRARAARPGADNVAILGTDRRGAAC